MDDEELRELCLQTRHNAQAGEEGELKPDTANIGGRFILAIAVHFADDPIHELFELEDGPHDIDIVIVVIGVAVRDGHSPPDDAEDDDITKDVLDMVNDIMPYHPDLEDYNHETIAEIFNRVSLLPEYCPQTENSHGGGQNPSGDDHGDQDEAGGNEHTSCNGYAEETRDESQSEDENESYEDSSEASGSD